MNKTFKKLVALFTALVLALGVFAVYPCAAEADIAVKTDRDSYLQGETVTATVYFPHTVTTIASMDLMLLYDSTKFEIVSVTDSNEFENAIKAQTNGKVFSEYWRKAGEVKWSLAATNNFTFSGSLATVVLRVKNTAADGKTPLTLSLASAANSGYVSVVGSTKLSSASVELIKVAANDLAYELTADKKGYEVVGYYSLSSDKITIPAVYASLPVVSINPSAFMNHTELKSIVLPDSLKYIGKDAFKNCTGITSMAIPDTVETIGEAAFSGCTSLKSVTLPIGLTTIEKDTFNGCAITAIEIPFTVTKIGGAAFGGYNINIVKISKNTTDIAADAFSSGAETEFEIVEGNTYIPKYIADNMTKAKTTLIDDISLGTAAVAEYVQYTGNVLTPAVTVALTNEKTVRLNNEYKVVYRNNVNLGKATVYIAGIGSYGEGYIINFTVMCNHNWKKVLTLSPTCTKAGYNTCTCAICGTQMQEEVVPTNHKPGDWILDKRPTLYVTGLKHNVCTVCGAIVDSDVVVNKSFPDLNGDKKINSSDALIILQYATGLKDDLSTQELFINADTNGDGRVNSSDALDVLQISIGVTKIDGYTA